MWAIVDKIRFFFRKTIVTLLLIGIWELLPRAGLVDAFILPPFSDVVSALVHLSATGELFVHIGASLQRSLTGFILAMVLAIPLGVLLGWFTGLEQVFDPVFQIIRNTSVLAIFPIFILLFGIGEISKAAIIFWGCIWPMVLNTVSGVKNIDPLLVKAARSMGISDFALFRKVVVPASMPSILTGIRLSAGLSIIILVAAEMLGASKGMGFLIYYSEQKYEIPNMYAGIITVSTVGVLVNYLLVLLEKRVIGWKEQRNYES